MDLSPRHLLHKAVQAVTTAGRAVEREADHLAAKAKLQADWLVLTLGDTPLPDSVQDFIVHTHQHFSAVPHEPPALAVPTVKPTGRPVLPSSTQPTELWPQDAPALDRDRPARAVAFRQAADGEGRLTVKAAAPGTDWGTPGRESAVMSVFVDGRHNQDVVLHGGAATTEYPLSLGPLAAGDHTITLAYNQAASRAGATGVQVASARLEPAATGVQALAEKYQPYFYGRGMDNNHTDVPLLMWCEVTKRGTDTVLHYSVMHSNEDGGTAADPGKEQSSWGRETDPDPIATVVVDARGALKDVRYTGFLDETGKFRGTFEGGHPVLRVAADNNSYDDRGTGPMLFRPRVEVRDFTGGSRESLMDENPWMYKLSNEELKREGKLLTDAEADAAIAKMGQPGFERPRKVMDLRRYLYLDFGAENPRHTQIAVAVKLKGSPTWYRSDWGDRTLDVLWAGDGLRTTVPLPAGVKPSDIETIRVLDEGGSAMTFKGIHKAFMLNDAYEPQPVMLGPGNTKTRVAKRSAIDLPTR